MFFSVGRIDAQPTIRSLLPEPAGWTLTEPPSTYLPGTLFEYIDGAAENYLSYGFRELAVGNYKDMQSGASLTVEIYDMGDETRAFGIYSSERYPESRFLEIGSQGYIEEGALNFIAGSYYVKLLCFDCGEHSEKILTKVAGEVEKKVPFKGMLPPLLQLFPKEGLIVNSERFVLQNVLGYGFFHHGYIATYSVEGQEFELLIIQATSPQEAESMMKRYMDGQRESGQPVDQASPGFHIRDRYSGHLYIAPSGKLILGVMRIKDGMESLGQKYLKLLMEETQKQALN